MGVGHVGQYGSCIYKGLPKMFMNALSRYVNRLLNKDYQNDFKMFTV